MCVNQVKFVEKELISLWDCELSKLLPFLMTITEFFIKKYKVRIDYLIIHWCHHIVSDDLNYLLAYMTIYVHYVRILHDLNSSKQLKQTLRKQMYSYLIKYYGNDFLPW